MDRRTFVAGAAALTVAARSVKAQKGSSVPGVSQSFPKGFLWGAATAGHQVEGNNTSADLWLLENVKPTSFAEPSGDADNSFALWPKDLDLAKRLGLNSYRFSLEWARIEPEPGLWSAAMLDHYKQVLEGCRERGLTPVVTFNHFTTPRWFAARGGWTSEGSSDLFARFCERAAKDMARGMGYATTLNEPNLPRLLREVLPPQVIEQERAAAAAAARACGSEVYVAGLSFDPRLIEATTKNLLAAHAKGRAAIKAERGDLPVGVSLAMADDQAGSAGSVRDAKRAEMYGAWMDGVRGDDFLGVQNYERTIWGAEGRMPAPAEARRDYKGAEVYPPSLAGAVRYAHQATGLPILVTEHGVGTEDDSLRAWFIPRALTELKAAMDEGVPVQGYLHWSLLDNFEWIFGYKPKFGLCAVDRTTFKRTPKPSAEVLGQIARANRVG